MHRPSDRDVNWMSPVQGESPPVQVKEPYGNLDMLLVGFHPATWSVQSQAFRFMVGPGHCPMISKYGPSLSKAVGPVDPSFLAV